MLSAYVETHAFSSHQFALKVRAELVTDDVLQVRIYRNGDHADYSYQLLRGAQPIMRWDNKEHFPEIASHPHHFIMLQARQSSPLTGDAARDLPLVLNFLFPSDRT